MDNGWIKLHRSIQSHWIYQDAKKLKWWFDMLFMANWEEKKVLVGNTLVTIKRGQLMASNSFLVEKWCVCSSTVRNFLQLLESDNMITQTAYPKYNVITICNYDKYQVAGETPVDPYAEVKVDPKTYPNAYPNTHPKADPNKEYKEYKESKENNIISLTHARAREDEGINSVVSDDIEQMKERYRAELCGNTMTNESARRIYGLTNEQLSQALDIFTDKLVVDGDTRKAYGEYRKYFGTWLKVNAKRIFFNQENNTASNGNRYQYTPGADLLNEVAEGFAAGM